MLIKKVTHRYLYEEIYLQKYLYLLIATFLGIPTFSHNFKDEEV